MEPDKNLAINGFHKTSKSREPIGHLLRLWFEAGEDQPLNTQQKTILNILEFQVRCLCSGQVFMANRVVQNSSVNARI